MLACPSCGARNPEDARSCLTCGVGFQAVCAECCSQAPSGARFCPVCGSPLNGGTEALERKLVTVLFADIAGSTALGERLDPERLRLVLDTCFSALAAAIDTWGGTVEKFIGDAVVAVFGVPLAHEDDAERAVHAALDVLGKVDTINAGLVARHDVHLSLRIGVATGEVIALTGRAAHQRLVTGDAVNLAARLQQSAELGAVIVDARTHLACRGAFDFADPLHLSIKGKEGVVTAHRVLTAHAQPSRGIPGLRAAMVGRERELGMLLLAAADAVETRRGRLITVEGPAGIGKSRLLDEFQRRLAARHPGARVLIGRCPSIGHDTTLWPLAEMLRGLCGISLDEPASRAAERLRNIIGPLLGRGGLPDVDRMLFALAVTAGVSIPGSPLLSADPRTVAQELALAWPALAAACAVDGPALLVVEDVHWASTSLLDLLERVGSVSAPVIVLLSARPETGDARGDGPPDRGARIVLEPLTSAQGRELMDALLVGGDLPDTLRARILSRAEGNPYFIEELVHRLIDEGVLRRDDAGWAVNENATVDALPDSIHALLAARVDRLPAREKRVLQEGAVIGRTFWVEPIALSLQSDVVPDLLDNLQRKDLVAVQPSSSITGCIEYAFRHVLVRDVAYATLSRSRRARAHAEIGDWLNAVAGDRREELADLIAGHYGAAVEDEEAELAWGDAPESGERVRWCAWDALLLAGRIARQRFEIDGAVGYHERALRLARGDAERVCALEELGVDHSVAYQSSRAQEAYTEALELARHLPTSADRARLCARIVAMVCAQPSNFGRFWSRGEVDAVVDEGLIARPEPIDRAQLLLGRAMGTTLTKDEAQDNWTETARIDAAREAMELAEELGAADIAARAVQLLGNLYWSVGSFDDARDVTRAFPAYAEQVRSEIERISLLHGYATQLLCFDVRFEEALRTAQRTREVARRISPHEYLHATSLIIHSASALGRWSEVSEAIDQHLATMEEDSEAACGLTLIAPLIGATTLVHMGETERAAVAAERVAIGDREWVQNGGLVPTMRAFYDLARGEASIALEIVDRVLVYSSRDPCIVDAAIAKLEALVQLSRWDGLEEFLPAARVLVAMNARLAPYCDWAAGRRAAASGDIASAARVLSAALSGFDEIGVVFEAARTREALAGVSASQRQVLLTTALATYERIGAHPHALRLRKLQAGHGQGGSPVGLRSRRS